MPFNQEDQSSIIQFIQKNNLKINHQHHWKNFSKNQRTDNSLVLDIEDVVSLQKLLEKINKLNTAKEINQQITLRVAAGGRDDNDHSESYSFTAGAKADVIIRLVGKEFLEIQKLENDDHIVRVGANVQIGELDKTLYENYQLCLPTSSLIPWVTFVGLAANAGHGTGEKQPSVAGLIRAMTICLPNGKIVRIDHTHPLFETIRGAHLGLFGVVINVEVECMDAHKLQRVTEARSFSESIDEVKHAVFLLDDAVSMMCVPLPNGSENEALKNVIISRLRHADRTVNDVNFHPAMDHFLQSLEVKLAEELQISDLLHAAPSLVPYYMRYIVSRLEVGKKDAIAVGPWPEMMHSKVSFPRKIEDMDYLFEISEDCHEIIFALEKINSILKKFAAKNQYPVDYAMYVRVFAGTNGGLSTSHHAEGKRICAFDIVSSVNAPGYKQFRDEVSDFFINQLNAKPHWGKYVPENIDYEKIYGNRFKEFIDALKKWYMEHGLDYQKSPLLNDFFRKILKLPYASTLVKKMSVTELSSITSVNKKLIDDILPCIDKDDEYGKNLVKRLEMLKANPTLSDKPTLFHQNKLDQDKSQTKKNKKCLII